MEFDILSLSPQGGNICLCCEHKQLVIFIVHFFFICVNENGIYSTKHSCIGIVESEAHNPALLT